MDCVPLDFFVCSDEMQQQQKCEEEKREWTRVGTSGARRRQTKRPKFKLGSLVDHGNFYQAISVLEREYPTLQIQVGVNLNGEYVLTPKNDDCTTLLRSIAEKGNKVLLLSPKERDTRRCWSATPLDLSLEAVEAHPQVASAQRLNHLQARCEHAVRCWVCSLPHHTEECIACHKNKEAITARCPNCRKNHHVCHPQCPERLSRMPRPRQQHQQHPGSDDDVDSKHSKGNPSSSKIKLSNSRVPTGMHHVASGSSISIHHVPSQEGFPIVTLL